MNARLQPTDFSAVDVSRARLESVIDLGGVRSYYQPLVSLDTGTVIGFEALARGPRDSDLERPDQLFGHAHRLGLIGELDWACRTAALEGAIDLGFKPPMALFMNVEPAAFGSRPSQRFQQVADRLDPHLPIVVEFTERALAHDPAALLAAADWVRERGWGVALDDIGADPESLALMPFLAPEVLKLDLRLVQRRTDVEIAGVIAAVNAQAERTGAMVLAEGIETAEHEELARSMGARLAQGWLYGRPDPHPDVRPASRPGIDPWLKLRGASYEGRLGSPFEVAAQSARVQRADKPLLVAMSKLLERQAVSHAGESVVLAAFQSDLRFTRQTRLRYNMLSRRSQLVVALGVGMPREPVGSVVGAALHPNDPLVHEWDLTVVGPHFAAALLARDVGDPGPDRNRRFDYLVTYDRDIVLPAARSMLRRVTQAELGIEFPSAVPDLPLSAAVQIAYDAL